MLGPRTSPWTSATHDNHLPFTQPQAQAAEGTVMAALLTPIS